MKVPNIIGADLSKKSIDFATPQGMHVKVHNDLSGFKEMIKWLNDHQINASETLIVMEHTGLYSYRLELFLHQEHIIFTKVSSLAIKRSMGLVRGKSDKIDALRIARYGFEKVNQLLVNQPTSKSLERLQLLHTTRDRLVKQRTALIVVLKEYKNAFTLSKTDLIIQSHEKLIKAFDGQIKKINDSIRITIDSEQKLQANYRLLLSIKGVGKVLAVAVIIKTANFSRFFKARKFACYCGVAPFENTSGSSIRGKTRVSHLADKQIKTLLDLAAKSAIQNDKELKEYYLKKVQAGKPKMSVINVVRNKILYRMFAIINRQTPFIDKYLSVA